MRKRKIKKKSPDTASSPDESFVSSQNSSKILELRQKLYFRVEEERTKSKQWRRKIFLVCQNK